MQSAGEARPASIDEQFSRLLSAMNEELKDFTPPGQSRQLALAAAPANFGQLVASIRGKGNEMRRLYSAVADGFKETGRHLDSARVADEIQQRHADAMTQFEARRAEFERLLANIDSASPDSAEQQDAVAAMARFMARYNNAKPHSFGRPDRLPFGATNPAVRAPNLSKDDYQASLFPQRFKPVLLAGPVPSGLSLAAPALPDTPTAADLAATDEVQLTPAIRERAEALGKDPVKIYNWVRNNVRYIPSYGSIQGSEMTLLNQRGNAFDTASLLIALYRASGIPARYVYGTIEVPTERMKAWLGGVTNAQAAQQVLGQGGIPNTGLVAGGAVKAIRMEHVWAQAYVDYHPSRGAVSRAPSTWVPVDASFKQNQENPGMNVAANVPLKADELAAKMQEGATYDASQGYMQGLDAAKLQAHMQDYYARVKEYGQAQNASASIADLIGGRTILGENYSVLLGSLPYRTLVVGNVFQALPDRLKWRFKTNIYNANGIDDGDSPIIEIDRSTAQLAGKKISLNFVPASTADGDLLNSYLPRPHADGSPILPSELPSTLPGYLFKLKAELRVDGKMVAQSPVSFSMGTLVRQSNRYFNPSAGTWQGGEDNDITAGEYSAIALDLQGTQAWQMQQVQQRLERTKAKLMAVQLNPADPTPLQEIGNEEIVGDTLHSAMLAYFSHVDNTDAVMARQSGDIVSYRMPSYGRLTSSATVQYWFGLPRNVVFKSVEIDVDQLSMSVTATDGDPVKRKEFVRRSGGLASAAEHQIPERLFRDPQLPDNDPNQAQAVSAVKALARAAAAGQKIYWLTQANQATHAAALAALRVSADVKRELGDALAAGKEVVVHEADIQVGGWIGSGYEIIDPDSGAGAYKIAGGANGGNLTATIAGFTSGLLTGLALSGLVLNIAAGTALSLGLAGFAVLAVNLLLIVLITSLIMRFLVEKDAYGCYAGAFGAGFGVGSWPAGLGWLPSAIAGIFGWMVTDAPPGYKCITE